MDRDRFDALTKSLVTRRSGIGLGLAALLGNDLPGVDAKPKRKPKPKPKCKPPKKKCGGKCLAVKTDRQNCGACNKTCAPGETCANGACTDSGGGGGGECPGNQQPCGSGCIPAGACCRDNDACNGTGRCLNGDCRARPDCLPNGATFPDTETRLCCSKQQVCLPGTDCECVSSDPGGACLTDVDCRTGPCLGYFCSDCGGGDCRSGYRLVGVFGKSGIRGGEFGQIWDLAVDPDHNLYVVDLGNQRVQKLTRDGEFVFQIGETRQWGRDNAHLYNPRGVALDTDGNIYVGDDDNARVQKFSPSGAYQKTFGVSGQFGSDNGHFKYATGVAVDAAGNLYVADFTNYRVQKLSASGTYLRTFGVTGQGGTDNNHFDFDATSVAVGPNGDLFVADSLNYRVQQFAADGSFVRTFGVTGQDGSDNAHFDFVTDIAADTAGNLYVADTNNERVQVFGPTGAYRMSIDVEATKPRYAYDDVYVHAVAVDRNGDLYLADSNNFRILRYAPITDPSRARASDVRNRSESDRRAPRGKRMRRSGGKQAGR